MTSLRTTTIKAGPTQHRDVSGEVRGANALSAWQAAITPARADATPQTFSSNGGQALEVWRKTIEIVTAEDRNDG